MHYGCYEFITHTLMVYDYLFFFTIVEIIKKIELNNVIVRVSDILKENNNIQNTNNTRYNNDVKMMINK